jgi:hypothetical protein
VAGTLVTVSGAELTDGEEFPLAFSAITVNVYEVLEFNPPIVIGEEVPFTVILPGLDTT